MLITRQPNTPAAVGPGRKRRVLLGGSAWGRLWFVLAISCLVWPAIGLAIGPAVGDERLAYDPASRDDEIRRLIDQLDDRSFSNRETASIKLANIGAPALRALAMTVFEGSPESAWRTKTAIELIGTHGDEDVFLKSLGILQILYLNGSDSLDQKFLELQLQWKLEQKKIIVTRLRELGAKVLDPQQNNNAANVGLPRRRIINNIVVEVIPANRFSVELEPTTTASSPRRNDALRQVNLDIDETTKKIDGILLATLEENRKLVLGNKPAEPEPLKLSADSSADEILQIRQAVIRQRVRQSLTGSANGIVVSLDDQWQGADEDIQTLNDLHGLSKIELLNFHPGKKQLDEISRLESVAVINIEGDQIPDKDLVVIQALPNLTGLEFANRAISGRLLSGFAGAKSLNRITFVKCDLPGTSLRKLQSLGGLRSLYLKEMQIGEDIFRALARMQSVTNVNLSICKFKTTDYQELVNARPKLRITYTPQAFLGVRGATFANGRECQISDVVAGSGAEKGGIQVGDVIMKIDGQPIEQFEDLRLHIAQHKAGESLEVQVRRDLEVIKLTVVLGSAKNNLEN